MSKISVASTILKAFGWLKAAMLALALAVYEYLQYKITKLKIQNDRTQLELDKRKAHDEIDQQAAQLGPDAILDDAIRAGGGTVSDEMRSPGTGEPNS
jgi:hypothetical protein